MVNNQPQNLMNNWPEGLPRYRDSILRAEEPRQENDRTEIIFYANSSPNVVLESYINIFNQEGWQVIENYPGFRFGAKNHSFQSNVKVFSGSSSRELQVKASLISIGIYHDQIRKLIIARFDASFHVAGESCNTQGISSSSFREIGDLISHYADYNFIPRSSYITIIEELNAMNQFSRQFAYLDPSRVMEFRTQLVSLI